MENGWDIVDSVLEACQCIGEALPNQFFELLGTDGVSDDEVGLKVLFSLKPQDSDIVQVNFSFLN